MLATGNPMNHQPVIPPRVQTALQLLHSLGGPGGVTQMVQMHRDPALSAPESAEKTPKEKRAYESALECLSNYLSGEMNFGDVDSNSTGAYRNEMVVKIDKDALDKIWEIRDRDRTAKNPDPKVATE